MDEPGFFSSANVLIIGMGLMGGSLAMGLKGHCRRLIGVDIDNDTLAFAMKSGIVDEVYADPKEAVPQADIIFLATPVKTILSLIEKIPHWRSDPAVVIDLGSTKAQICQALADMPDRFDVLGGHPMCGKEALGIANADPQLFKDAPFAFVGLPRTTHKAVEIAEQVCRILSAKQIWLEAEVHDRWVASTSHMPYLIASALALSTPDEVSPMVGPGLRSTTRLAGTPVSMMMDVLTTNRNNVLDGLRQFRAELDRMIELLHNQDDQDLSNHLINAAQIRHGVIQQGISGGLT